MDIKIPLPSTPEARRILENASFFMEDGFQSARCAFCGFEVRSQLGANVLRRLMTHTCEAVALPRY